jgi:16S rRNA G966 N2-methylase RsmD
MNRKLLKQLKSEEVKTFMLAHEKSDPLDLLLKRDKYPELPIPEIVEQLISRKKAKNKLPEFYENAEIVYPPILSMEQCSSEATARYKSQICQGKKIIDLTGGFGIDLYYLSKRFQQATYVERNVELSNIAQLNFATLSADNIESFSMSAEQYLQEELKPATSYYLDPARRNDANNKVFRLEECTPNMAVLLPLLRNKKAEVIIKLAPLLDITQALRVLKNVKEVHVVAVRNEVKELLFRIIPSWEKPVKIIAVNLLSKGTHSFGFDPNGEKESVREYGMPSTYLYEPNAAIMKAGGFNSIAIKFDLKKLHRNSHLYTSEEEKKDFFGRHFKIKHITSLNKKKIKKLLPQMKANITVRNCPHSVNEIRKKTGISDGGDVYLFVTTILSGEIKVLICEKMR